MKFTIGVPGLTLYPGERRLWYEQIPAADLVRMAQAADALGYDYLVAGEHIAMHDDWVGVMGPRWSHCLSALSVLGGATSRIALGSISVVPYHNPIEFAHALATVDFLTDGRMLLIGLVGYMEWEFEMLGAPPFAQRGAVMDEYLAAMVEIWERDRPSFHGTYVDFDSVVFGPRPAQQPFPMWLGGQSKPALRRVARFADGWWPWAITRAQLAQRLAYIRAQPEFQDRPRTLDVFFPLFEGETDERTHAVISPPKIVVDKDAILEQIQQLADLGVTVTEADAIVGGNQYGGEEVGVRSTEEYIERLQWFAEEIFPQARHIVPATTG